MKMVIVAVLLMVFVGLGCGKKISNEDVATKVAEALCGKMKECAPQLAAEPTVCFNALKESLMKPLQAKGKKGGVKEKELESCLSEIKSLNCNSLADPAPPSSCSFFKKD